MVSTLVAMAAMEAMERAQVSQDGSWLRDRISYLCA